MTVRARRLRRFPGALQVAGTIAAAGALALLAAVAPAGTARAAAGDTYDQITGQGSTSSQLSVNWTSGLLDSSNKPLTTAASEPNSNADRAAGTGSLSYMDGDFKNLKVTVSQTQNLHHQAITVTWSGMKPSSLSHGIAQDNYLQLMECYGDASTGPDPENCEFGAPGIFGVQGLPVGVPDIAQRSGFECGGVPAAFGCDPLEPGSHTPPHECPNSGCPGVFDIPFVSAADPTTPAYDVNGLRAWYSAVDSNEVVQAVSDASGAGIQHFEAVTGVESQGLGCGDDNNGQPRGCWLVIVPRGTWEPDGFQIDPANESSTAGYIASSPLSAGNWAQRIQIHLGYATEGLFCGIDTPEIPTVGTQTIQRAMQSWQLALNEQGNCSSAYSFTQHTESETTTALLNVKNPASGAGLGFTTIPIGAETTEGPSGGAARKVPKLLYAPVAVTALDFGFNVDLSGIGSPTPGIHPVSTSVKVTPQLLAKALTQVYKQDLPDYFPGQVSRPDGSTAGPYPGPAWATNNPPDITRDPEFQGLNGTLVPPWTSNPNPLAPQLIGDNSAQLQQVWQWIDSSPAASAWLSGTPDTTHHIVADPDYTSLKLGKPATPAKTENWFPHAYAGILNLGSLGLPPHQAKRTSLDLLPAQLSFDSAAVNVLTSNNPAEGGWDPSALDPSGELGWWAKLPQQVAGNRFAWALVDTPSLAAYQLDPGAMCAGDGSNGHGANCVSLDASSVAAALKTAKADSAGLLQVDPGKAQAAGAYPLVSVIYAAVPVAQPAASLNQYANLIEYAAGKGQTTGAQPGDLPPGYLPLPKSLADQAKSVVAQLRALANPNPSHPATPSPRGTGGSPNSGSSSNAATNGNGGAGASAGGTTTHVGYTPGTSSSNPAPAASPTQSLNIEPPAAAQLASGTTPRQPEGPERVALIVVVIAGLGSAGAGILLRSGRMPGRRRRAGGARQ